MIGMGLRVRIKRQRARDWFPQKGRVRRRPGQEPMKTKLQVSSDKFVLGALRLGQSGKLFSLLPMVRTIEGQGLIAAIVPVRVRAQSARTHLHIMMRRFVS
jgi:hypothetical protein